MAPYFLIFFLAASFTVLAPPDAPRSGGGLVAFILFAIFLALMIGFRWQVGGDWGWDIVRMLELGDGDITDYITNASDPGYGVLMWLGAKSGFNIWFVHLLGGGLFVYGLSRRPDFCSRLHLFLATKNRDVNSRVYRRRIFFEWRRDPDRYECVARVFLLHL